MVRVLALIAFVGFILAVACFAGAAALGGSDIAEHGWKNHKWHIDIDDDDDNAGRRQHRDRWDLDDEQVDGSGPSTTREIAWDGGDTLRVSVPADVRYTQGPGPAKLVITGSKGAVDHIELDGGRLRFDTPLRGSGRLTVIMTAPDVTRFELQGDNKLVIAAYQQPSLAIDMSGSADVSAEGTAGDVDLQISGSGDADLGRIAAQTAKVDIAGSGKATVSPQASAELDISGSGEVTLLTHPATLHSDISGSGRIIQAAPKAPATPAKK